MSNHLVSYVTTGPAANRAQAIHAFGHSVSVFGHQQGTQGVLFVLAVLIGIILLLSAVRQKTRKDSN
jgi:hypothetical protein